MKWGRLAKFLPKKVKKIHQELPKILKFHIKFCVRQIECLQQMVTNDDINQLIIHIHFNSVRIRTLKASETRILWWLTIFKTLFKMEWNCAKKYVACYTCSDFILAITSGFKRKDQCPRNPLQKQENWSENINYWIYALRALP